MFPSFRSCSPSLRLLSFIILAGIILVSCGPSTNQPAAPTNPYDRAAEAFKKGQLDNALDITDKLARAMPPAYFTERAQVLRAGVADIAGTLAGRRPPPEKAREKIFEILVQVARTLIEAPDVDQILSKVVDLLFEHLPVEPQIGAHWNRLNFFR